MHPPSSARHQVRMLLDRQLRTDGDLDAFCIDFFPDIYQRFTASMERTQKVNLLLALQQDTDLISHRLSQRRSQGSKVTLPRKPTWLLGCCVVLMLALLLAARATTRRASSVPVEPPRTAAGASPPAATTSPSPSVTPLAAARASGSPLGVNSGNQIVNSPSAQLSNSAHLLIRASGSTVNSGNRIKNSPGARMSNTVVVAGSP